MQPMQLITAAASLASVALARPSLAEDSQTEIHVFKRGEPLMPEDLDLAERHGVNTTEMFKHSVIRRRDEEDFTIWVDNGFLDADADADDVDDAVEGPEADPAIVERAMRYKILHPYHKYSLHREQCFSNSHVGNTGPNAPCTGGLQHIKDWASKNPGYWKFVEETTAWRTLIAAGSNGGCNGRFRAQRNNAPGRGDAIQMGNADVFKVMKHNLKRHTQVFNGVYRMRAYGRMNCGEYQTPVNYQINEWDKRV